MIWRGEVTTDANGLILYDPVVFREAYGAKLQDGTPVESTLCPSPGSGDEAEWPARSLKLAMPSSWRSTPAYRQSLRIPDGQCGSWTSSIELRPVCRTEYDITTRSECQVRAAIGDEEIRPKSGDC